MENDNIKQPCSSVPSSIQFLASCLKWGPAVQQQTISTLTPIEAYTYVGGIEKLPALESLHAEMRGTAGPLASPSLQQLSLEGLCGFTMHAYPSLGSLPRLRRLHIKLIPSLAVSR